MTSAKLKCGENELGIPPRLLTTEQRRHLFRKFMEERKHDSMVLRWDDSADGWPNPK